MSAQKTKPSGVIGAIAGLLGLSVLAGVLVTAMVTPAIAVTGLTAQSSIGIFNSLPDYLTLDSQSQKNTIYTLDNNQEPVEIASIYHQNREEIAWEDVNENVKNALLAAEDRKFYEHGGVNISSTIRAALGNVVASDITSGASTLTMQLVKNILIMRSLEEETQALRAEARAEAEAQTIDRKLREMKLAIGLEKRYTKNEIMLGYLNIAGFGGNTYGIQAAANQFYSVDAKDLTLPQAASLIAIVQTPTYHTLRYEENYEANKKRRDFILHTMFELGYIEQAELDEAAAAELDVVPSPPQGGCINAAIAKYFCDFVEKHVPELESLGATAEERLANWQLGGYQIYTTLDHSQQKNAEATVLREAPAEENRFSLGSAASVVEPGTGRILAMAQNKIYDPSDDDNNATTTVNYNTDKPYGGSSGFQVGSTYKIFTLAEWLKQNHGLNETVDGRVKTYDQTDFPASCTSFAGSPPWKVPNYGGVGGSISTSVMRATAQSINSAFAGMAVKLDQCAIRDTALSMGVHRADGGELEPYPAAILGTNEIAPLSLASAFATVASGGTYCKPIAIDRIVDADGEELPGQSQECTRSLTPEVAAGVAYALRGVMTGGGTGRQANPADNVKVIGKTGTTDSAIHTWMAGASTKAALAVWVGNVVGKQNLKQVWLPGGIGDGARYRIFKGIMGPINGEYGGGDFPAPPSRLLSGQLSTVPDVSGQSEDQVRSLLQGLGFTPQKGADRESSMTAGRAVGTSPGAGAKISQGSVVTYYLSDGSLTQTMPDVLGMTAEDAAAAVAAQTSGAISYAYVKTEDVTLYCTVSASNPGPGKGMTATTPVALTVYSNEDGAAPPAGLCGGDAE
ncbi:MAG: transglycosylase domain-containing protein [Homoserinimonas sp.]